MIALSTVARGFYGWWQAQLSSEEVAIFPGMRMEAESLPEWTEVWLGEGAERPARSGADLLDVQVTVHVFARTGADAGRLNVLVDGVRARLRQAVVALPGTETTEAILRLREPAVRELTRRDRERGSGHLRHAVVTCAGVIQQV